MFISASKINESLAIGGVVVRVVAIDKDERGANRVRLEIACPDDNSIQIESGHQFAQKSKVPR